jgi:PAS domain S-box-containing protein
MFEQNSQAVLELLDPRDDQARRLLDSLHDYAIFMLDISGRVRSWSSGAERIKGYTREEILGRHFSVFFPPDENAAEKCERELRIAEEEGRFEEEGWRVRKSGERFWASVILTPMRDAKGQVIGFAKVTRDLTERRKAEEQLRQSEERFRLMVMSVKDYAMFMVGPHGRVESWNTGAQRIKGYEAGEIIGQPITRFYPDEAVAQGRPWDLLREAAVSGHVEDEGWRVRKDGSLFWADVVITAMRDERGELRGFAKVTRDLTERRKTEEMLRRSEERFRLMVTSVKDYAIFMLDPEGRVMTWNSGAAQLKGYSAREIVGEHFSRFYSSQEVAQGKPARELAIARQEGRFEEEGWRVRKDGTTFWASVVITPMLGDAGTLLGFAKVTRDLTERKRSEEERLRLAQAQEAIRLRDEFLAIASHELRTPLTALQLQLHSLRARASSFEPGVTAKLDRAVHSTERLAGLIETLLDVSRLSTGQLTLKPERMELLATVKDMTGRLQEAAVQAACPVLVREGPAIEGTWDRLRIEQVISNLLANAFKYAAGSPVELAVMREGPEAVLVIQDKGPGIPETEVARLFHRFERAAPMKHYGGLGLGLYVARQIVEAHGGNISVENAPEGGARFTVRLPT